MGAETTNPKLNVAIIGGGLGGLALSIGLLPYRDALNITIYEAAPKFAEIGAGIASGPNAVNALNLISPDILRGYRKCATFNETRDHDNAWLTFRYGTNSKTGDGKKMDLIHHVGEKGKPLGDISKMLIREEVRRRSCVHRARFLDEMAALIPDGMAKFKKSLASVEDPEEDNKGLKLTFEDGETVLADVVIGCDGIKSVTRKFVMRNQSIEPKFSNTYAYRAMVPRDIAREAIGDVLALNGQSYLGYDRYMISYPVEHGNLINIVALKITKDVEWDEKNWLMPATKEEMASDLEGYEEKLVELVSKYCTGDKWGLFHLPHSQKYFHGRICLMGDAAHASTPHLGAGSGMAFEDAYVLSRLFQGVKNKDDIQKALEAYDTVRRPRSQKLVEFSKKAGELISFTHDDFGDDVKRIADEIDFLYEWVWTYDLEGSLVTAKQLSGLF
ncbi:putative mannitol 1-phosphate dehydrogenase protein [Botrytis fragariae]|uniref:Putative mannitol 1-phosphate dehydrogenase protein n=1 Tax=Botrytis fragariae TaxID=1964551 RepID=A0A8H6EH64_9HELO|nr:putative mannitol 1-phosphate dehydrogenase protein [Botrytis fragariae]KAF5872117.1 putative mannitol 1-phosphate dehydrogenase protein [Botrytis fragariae]